MSITRLSAFAIVAFAAAPALAQQQPSYPPPAPPPPGMPIARPGNEIGTGQSLPLSNQSSNITPGDTRSIIAPRLPAPDLGENAPPAAFLQAARNALAAGRTGEAQEALERAETRTLDRSVQISRANDPSRQPLVQQIQQARNALASGDRARTIQIIQAAMANPEATAPMR